MTWRLTRDAERDLDEMVSFGAREYGLEAALTCYDELAEKFELLATFPLIGRERETSTRTVRIMRFKAHHVIYALEGRDVLVLRVLHGSANWIDHL